ncbi:subtilisin-like protease SBT4.15 [Castanea sativa]|uniref:subtilisin-like protease SBT4.15 n=1 Tax=Castanea sativa TaxID=21020 RepID=UPI003F6506BE
MVRICMITLFLLATQLHWSFTHGSSDAVRKAYIVYLGEAPQSKASATELHHNLLSSVVRDDHIAQQSRIYSYTKSFNAFAANLLPQEVQRLKENENVVSVFPSKMRKLHTTRSWDFLGMPQSVKRNHQIESNIIVGVVDTGVYIDAPSFDDKGLGPPPSKWKGTCQVKGNFSGCNNKVIGARFYNYGFKIPNPSPLDEDGHGSHTSSTIAGSSIAGASLYGLAKGTARGGVPSARIAVYKVCWEFGCSDIDILAALDDAINDGVDLLSLSLGGDSSNYFENPIAVGAFHAMKKGILTTCSAGNDGPSYYTVENTAPWILTVGATGMDRQFRTLVEVGNGIKTSGFSINTFSPNKRMYPLTTATKAVNGSIPRNQNPWLCDVGSLDANKVKGKIVLCKQDLTQDYIKDIGGLGAIVSLSQQSDVGSTFVIPVAFIDTNSSNKIEKYVNSTRAPRAVIYKSTTVRNAATPFVASFSSRGPNPISSTILKPDIVAPGIDILAAYSKLASVTAEPEDNRFGVYNIISGTSMSCPHVAGAAAYVKSFHPNWSPSAIKSALMTTASELKIKDVETGLAYGAGQIDPVRAVDPGLIYDVSTSDYIRFLCNEGYTGTALRLFTDAPTNCSSVPDIGGLDALNYPSMYLELNDTNSSVSGIFHRTVTNVGSPKSIYKAIVKAPAVLKVTVVPNQLVFSHLNEKKSFTVVIKGPPLDNVTSLSASLEWNDTKHRVKSPIQLFWAV